MDFFVVVLHGSPYRVHRSHMSQLPPPIHTDYTLRCTILNTSNHRPAQDSATQNISLKTVTSSNVALGRVINKHSKANFQPFVLANSHFDQLWLRPFHLQLTLQWNVPCTTSVRASKSFFYDSFFFTKVQRGLLQETKTMFTFPLPVQHKIHFWGNFRVFY